LRLVREDGRHFLRTRREQFRTSLRAPPPPVMAGVVNLYTKILCRAPPARLAPGGLADLLAWPVVQSPTGAKALIAGLL